MGASKFCWLYNTALIKTKIQRTSVRPGILNFGSANTSAHTMALVTLQTKF